MVNDVVIEILLVEDNPNDAELTLRALKKNKIANSIVHVKDGEEALDFLFGFNQYANRELSNKPKLILLDLKLPKVSGIEVLQKIKSSEQTKFIPVVVLTSSKEERVIIGTYNLGVNSYIVKPVDFDKFIEAVRDLGFYWLVLNQRPSNY
ncbi:MAG TPA: response regulator [Melioribacteraceae bacterium]|nr:response regulator [Melioribacteraceae bacterium]